jgi:hypothetical protein
MLALFFSYQKFTYNSKPDLAIPEILCGFV